jgi:Na+:H+ antiporter, NhaA family
VAGGRIRWRARRDHLEQTSRDPAPSTRSVLLFPRLSSHELRVLVDALRAETVGGVLLLAATVVAMILANSGAASSYHHLQHVVIGPAALGLHLDLETWAADGLLAVFFFVAGLELKRELVAGEMRHLSAALVPVMAAIGGMVLPALSYLAVNAGHSSARGWAIPSATDIAFALAVLAVAGRHLPPALRAFLLTLAVVDDIGAILVIAIVYTSHLRTLPLLGAVAGLVVFWLLQRRRFTRWWLTVPLAVVIWALVHESGIHATVAGVALGLLVPATAGDGDTSPAERLEHLVRPVSSSFAVPGFALLSAGLTIDAGTLHEVFTGRIGLGVIIGLVAGKTGGVLGGAYLTARFTHARLSPGLAWSDVLAVAVLSGMGFTVSLLISDLAFGASSMAADVAKTAVLIGSLLAGMTASIALRVRNGYYRQLEAQLAGTPGR